LREVLFFVEFVFVGFVSVDRAGEREREEEEVRNETNYSHLKRRRHRIVQSTHQITNRGPMLN